MRSGRLVDGLSGLVGPDVRRHGGKTDVKLAGLGGAIEWHSAGRFR